MAQNVNEVASRFGYKKTERDTELMLPKERICLTVEHFKLYAFCATGSDESLERLLVLLDKAENDEIW